MTTVQKCQVTVRTLYQSPPLLSLTILCIADGTVALNNCSYSTGLRISLFTERCVRPSVPERTPTARLSGGLFWAVPLSGMDRDVQEFVFYCFDPVPRPSNPLQCMIKCSELALVRRKRWPKMLQPRLHCRPFVPPGPDRPPAPLFDVSRCWSFLFFTLFWFPGGEIVFPVHSA